MDIKETIEFIDKLTDEERNFLKEELWKEFLESIFFYYMEIDVDQFLTVTIKKFRNEII